jgi:hypothetical protein
MKRLTIAALLATGLVFAATLYLPVDIPPVNRILISVLEERLGAKVDYGSLRIYLWRSIQAERVEAMGSGGLAMTADKVAIEYDPLSLSAGRLRVTCDLEDVRFYRSAVIASLSDLLQIEPLGDMTFNEVRLELFVGARDTITDNLTMTSDKIVVRGSAFTDRDDNILCALEVKVHDDLTRDIPGEIRGSLFKDEPGPWSSVPVRIAGNYSSPRFSIITDYLRLNIS